MSTVDDLRSIGGLVADEPVPKTITFQLDGEDEYTADIHVRKLSIGEWERIFVRSGSDDESRTARMISEIVLLGGGAERLSFKDAYTLHPRLADAMIKAIREVNGGEASKN